MLGALDALRLQASIRMGIAPDLEAARLSTSVPFVCIVGPPSDSRTLSGETLRESETDLIARVISNGQPHRALPLTISLCTAVAARIEGTIVAEVCRARAPADPLRLGMPSGVLTVGADVGRNAGEWVARSGSFYRTARRLFDGSVWVPGKTAHPRSRPAAIGRGPRTHRFSAVAGGYRRTRSRAAISPKIPRRNTSTQATKINPSVTVTHDP